MRELTSTGVAPAKAMLGRRLRTRLDAVRPGEARERSEEREQELHPGVERST